MIVLVPWFRYLLLDTIIPYGMTKIYLIFVLTVLTKIYPK